MNPLVRSSLADQVAARLKDGISSGQWLQQLPSEAELCRELQVSRVTLRRAIAQLVREECLEYGGSGRRHVIRGVSTKRSAAKGTIVRVLTPFSLRALGSMNHVILEHLSERLGAVGYRLETEYRPALFRTDAPDNLARLDDLSDTAAWVLFFATKAIQRWFAESRKLCLVMGYTYPAIDLPCVLIDVPATARHAAGLFYQRGHREMVYFIEELTSLSDQLGSAAFVETASRLGANARISKYGAGIPNLRRTIAATLALEPRPTAFFSSSPESCLTIMGSLIEAGLRIPEDVSLIAGWADSFLTYTVPAIACYQTDAALVGRRASELLVALLEHGPGKRRSVRILPEFIAGDTLSDLPSEEAPPPAPLRSRPAP